MRGEAVVLDLVLAIFGQGRGYTLDKLPISLIIYLVFFQIVFQEAAFCFGSEMNCIANNVCAVEKKSKAYSCSIST